MKRRERTLGIGVLVLSLTSLSACNLELNIHLDGSDEAETPSPAPSGQPTESPSSALPPAPPPPGVEAPPEVEGVIRDALWRPEAPRVVVERFLPPADGRDLDRRGSRAQGTNFLLAPRLLNVDEVAARVRKAYPPLLQEAGIEGTAEVEVHVTELGRVEAVELAESSGHAALDEAALEIALIQRFEPARRANGDSVAVWITVPITFRIR